MENTATLSNRESQVAELIAWGATKKEVANKLFISERTVENHARSIYEKTGVTKSNELSAWWFCQHFNISFDLSPLKRCLIACSLLILIIYYESASGNKIVTRFSRRTESRTTSRRKSENDDFLTFQSL